MAHPWYHAVMAARKYGGTPEDYLAVEQWMDFTKSHVPDCRHRLFLHNSWGIFVAEQVLGVTLRRDSDGKVVPMRPVLEDHVVQDFGRIPTLARCLDQLAPEPLEGEITTLAQCERSAELHGGTWNDYEAIHAFLDWPRDYLPDGRYRRILHNGWGVALTVEAIGARWLRPSDGLPVAVRQIAEEHLRQECAGIPTLESCLDGLSIERWMCRRAMPLSAVEQPGMAGTNSANGMSAALITTRRRA